jgi:hypothetical protein
MMFLYKQTRRDYTSKAFTNDWFASIERNLPTGHVQMKKQEIVLKPVSKGWFSVAQCSRHNL